LLAVDHLEELIVNSCPVYIHSIQALSRILLRLPLELPNKIDGICSRDRADFNCKLLIASRFFQFDLLHLSLVDRLALRLLLDTPVIILKQVKI
jgi:hypothetical protein